MSPQIILIALIAAPVVLLFLLRVNAALVFLSLCLGNVLVQFTAADVISIVSGAGTGLHTTSNIIKIVLLLAPAAATMLLMIRSVRSRQRQILNLLPAVGAGLLLALLVVPLLPPDLSRKTIATGLWTDIQQFQSGIVALSGVISLLFLWLQRPKRNPDEKAGKKHKG